MLRSVGEHGPSSFKQPVSRNERQEIPRNREGFLFDFHSLW